MNLREIEKLLSGLATDMDGKIDNVQLASTNAQQMVFGYLMGEIEKFEIKEGVYVTGQDYSRRFATIESEIEKIISQYYNPAINDYLKYYNIIEAATIQQQAAYNNIEVSKSLLRPTKQVLYNQAAYYLTQGLGDAYIQPAKFLMMQYVVKGSTVKEMRSAITNWDKGNLPSGQLASDIHAPRLQAYATQIARDTMYTYQGAVQDVIKNKYNLNKFIYVGGLVKDSRPFCRHLVNLRRKIAFDEIPQLVIAYPQGLKPGTTIKNFPLYRGGYSCNHAVMVVR